MPAFTQDQLKAWIANGKATAGGPGNTAPLVARMGLNVAVGACLGAGPFDGMDIQGRTFYDLLAAEGVDLSAVCIHPALPTGTTFIYEAPGNERGGIAYFPCANNDFDFEHFKGEVSRLRPAVVYYMYSGLSHRGDAHDGRDLAAFMAWCRQQGCITMADSHTLTGNPRALIERGEGVAAYRLLEPLLPELDIFFTSRDEARLIRNTLDPASRDTLPATPEELLRSDMTFLAGRFARPHSKTARLLGITVSSGALVKAFGPDGSGTEARMCSSRFMAGRAVDLVGAGDSFWAGLIAYVASHRDLFTTGKMDVEEAAQFGNLTASLYLTAPLHNRYASIAPYEKLLNVVRRGAYYHDLDTLKRDLGPGGSFTL
jgi:sugar/nucleoside kinase (ribokinase family)